jgi:hypothetical protein
MGKKMKDTKADARLFHSQLESAKMSYENYESILPPLKLGILNLIPLSRQKVPSNYRIGCTPNCQLIG